MLEGQGSFWNLWLLATHQEAGLECVLELATPLMMQSPQEAPDSFFPTFFLLAGGRGRA